MTRTPLMPGAQREHSSYDFAKSRNVIFAASELANQFSLNPLMKPIFSRNGFSGRSGRAGCAACRRLADSPDRQDNAKWRLGDSEIPARSRTRIVL